MSNNWNQTPDAFRLIRGLFILVAIVIVVTGLLLVTLSINETAKVPSGVIVSQTTPQVYVSPFEAKIKRSPLNEGAFVEIGDTLMVLDNDLLRHDYRKKKREIALAEENIGVYQRMLDNIYHRANQIKNQEGDMKLVLNQRAQGFDIEMANLRKQIKLLKEQKKLAQRNVERYRILVQDSTVSRIQYEAQYNTLLEQKKECERLLKEYERNINQKNTQLVEFHQTLNNNKGDILRLNFERTELEQRMIQEQGAIKRLRHDLEQLREELAKCYIVSDMEGYVTGLLTTKPTPNQIPKGTHLITVSPHKEEQFYAKLNLPQQVVKDVKVGQTAHLRLDAYNFYEYGLLKGTITYIGKDTSRYFYALAGLPNAETNGIVLKDGYSVKGDILLGRIKLYHFLWRRLFER